MQASEPAAPSGPSAPTKTVEKNSHTIRNVLLVILALLVLTFGGCLALLGGAVNEADKAIKNAEAKDEEPVGPKTL